MQEEIENKAVSLIINTSKLTERTLATAFMKVLRYSWSKVKTHHQAKPKGKQSVKKLIGQNQGVEQTELADHEEVKSFGKYARKYGVDYAIRKSISDDGKTRYIVFFKARDRSAIDQAMKEYANAYSGKRKSKQNVQPELGSPVPTHRKERVKEKGLNR